MIQLLTMITNSAAMSITNANMPTQLKSTQIHSQIVGKVSLPSQCFFSSAISKSESNYVKQR